MYIQLTWEDPEMGEVKRSLLTAPIAIGREFDQMPEYWGGESVSRLELAHPEISRFHVLMTVENNQIYITDQRSANGTFLNGRPLRQANQPISFKDTLRMGPYKMTATLLHTNDLNATAQSPNVSSFTPSMKSIPQQKVVVWSIGVGVLLLTAFGAWAMASTILERSRPQPSPTSPSSRAFVGAKHLRPDVSVLCQEPNANASPNPHS
ncbi:MAG: FHA domain-containing protein [Coleofasciculus sp. G3-WIS-01]|uniref:FHA domain-containing protein n=1 Tax=Coleofasciculus sp. G3-WIS-01 TaxID=3069528 RepID=UPI0032F7B707